MKNLENGERKTIQNLAEATKINYRTVEKYLRLINQIQSSPKLLESARDKDSLKFFSLHLISSPSFEIDKLDPPNQAYAICVFADTGMNGFYNPLYHDKTFDLIPIPEEYDKGPMFSEIIGIHNQSLSDSFPGRDG